MVNLAAGETGGERGVGPNAVGKGKKGDVVKVTVMLANMDKWAEMNKVYVGFFPKHFPARSAFGATGLSLGAWIEIECIAVLK